MPKAADRILIVALLITPVLLAVVLTALGITVGARDDINYLSEIASRPYFLVAPDQVSWIFLKLIVEYVPDQTLALRLVGLAILLVTVLVLTPRRAGPHAWPYFLVSILPLYWTIYFNQVRLGLGLMLFMLLLARGWKRLAPIGGAVGHSSTIVFLFPPAIIVAPFTLNLIELADPTSYASVRFAAYRDAEFLLMPWYFGWELIAVALVLAANKKVSRALALLCYAVAVRMLADLLSVDVARRLLELGLLAYSPIVAYLSKEEMPSKPFLWLYGALGALAAYAAFAGSVVSIGGRI